MNYNLTNIKIQGESNAQAIGLPRRRNAKSVMCIETGEIFSSIGDTAIHFGVNSAVVSNVLNPNKSIDNIRGYHLCFLSETMEYIDDITDARIAQNNKISNLTNGIVGNILAEQGMISNIITWITRVIRSNSQLSIDQLKPLGIEIEKRQKNKKIHHIKIKKQQSFALTVQLLNLNMFDIMDQIGIGLHNNLDTMSLYLERNNDYIIIASSDFYTSRFNNNNDRSYKWGWYLNHDYGYNNTRLSDMDDVYSVVVPSMLQKYEWRFGEAENLQHLIVKQGVMCCSNMSSYDKLYDVQLPQSIQQMSSYSTFAKCVSLQTINIPNNITTISSGAFTGCTNLTSINLPISLQKIGSRAFCNCKSLKSIIIPKTTTCIENAAFENCENLKEVILPNGLQTIHEQIFYGCIRLHTVTIPKSVKKIKKDAFRYCTALKTVTIHRNCIVEEDAFSSTTKIKYYD